MQRGEYCLLLFCLLQILAHVSGHGRLLVPPSRSSMWREKIFKTPVNYNDNELFCGGFERHKNQSYKCGVCGDFYGDRQPRENEAGGKYGLGIISRVFRVGQVIEAVVEITASHEGYFEFRICANNDPKKIATHNCLNTNVLKLVDHPGTKFQPILNNMKYTIKLQLPAGLVCTQCVLQWKYHTGNSHGLGPNGKWCHGCGYQEEFYGCADIAIVKDGPVAPPGGRIPKIIPIPTQKTTTRSSRTTTIPLLCKHYVASGAWKGNPRLNKWCARTCPVDPSHCPRTHCECAEETRVPKCRPTRTYGKVPFMETWCQKNCPGCPNTHCVCD